MTPINRRTALGLLGSTALVGCTAPEIASRNENDPFEGGIGGTGIVGIMTGYGSLLINGLRVDLTSKTQISSPYGRLNLNDAKPGMALTVVARRTPSGYFARDVAVDYALVGAAHRNAQGLITVNGVAVFPEPGAVGRVLTNRRVAVSGVWTPKGVVASRIDPAPHGRDLIAGTASLQGPTGLSIGGFPARTEGKPPADGEYAVALGRHLGGQFDAEEVRTGRFNTSVGLRQLSVEGYLEPVPSDPGFRIAGLGHSFARNLRLQPLLKHRAVYFGSYSGRFNASAGYVVPEQFTKRGQLLALGYARGFSGLIIPTDG